MCTCSTSWHHASGYGLASPIDVADLSAGEPPPAAFRDLGVGEGPLSDPSADLAGPAGPERPTVVRPRPPAYVGAVGFTAPPDGGSPITGTRWVRRSAGGAVGQATARRHLRRDGLTPTRRTLQVRATTPSATAAVQSLGRLHPDDGATTSGGALSARHVRRAQGRDQAKWSSQRPGPTALRQSRATSSSAPAVRRHPSQRHRRYYQTHGETADVVLEVTAASGHHAVGASPWSARSARFVVGPATHRRAG